MKLKEFLKLFENSNPELELEIVDESNQTIEFDLDSTLRLYEDDKFCIVKISPHMTGDDEWNAIMQKAFDDGFYHYKNMNPYRKHSFRWQVYEDDNNRGMVAADQ